MIFIALLLAAYAFGGAHAQDWNCLGPQPSVTAHCVLDVAGRPDERR